MSGIHYQLKKRLFRLKAYRRKGVGVRSDAAIHLITNVIGAKLHYYAFRELQETRELTLNLLKSSCKSAAISSTRANYLKEEILNLKRGKSTDRLIFRLMNYYRVKKPLFIGDGLSYTKAYMAKVDSRVMVNCVGECLKNQEINSNIFKNQLKIDNIKSMEMQDLKEIDFVVFSNLIQEKNIELFIKSYKQYLSRPCTMVFLNKHRSSILFECWKQLKNGKMFNFHIDMHSIGILVSHDERDRKNYVKK